MKEKNILDKKWKEGSVPHIDGIIFQNGMVVLQQVYSTCVGSDITLSIEPVADSQLDSVLKYNPDAWVEVTSLASMNWDDSLEVVCGEGAMGNEGFIAAIRRKENCPEWILFCSKSNPFISVERRDHLLVVEGGYDYMWEIPMDNPVALRIIKD